MFFLAEFATAVAGWVLEINPFDQPNVQEAKDATKRVLAAGPLPELPLADDDGAARAAGRRRPPGGYIAADGLRRAVDRVRRGGRGAARDADARARGSATTFGYGPRFLHSTGQLHKGGPPVGRFLSLIADEGPDVEIPGAELLVPHAEDRAGARRPRDAALARPAGRDRPPEGDPASALRDLHTRIKEMP